MEMRVKFLVVLLSISAVVSFFVLLSQGCDDQTLYFHANKWIEGVVPDEYVEASSLPLEHKLVSLAKTSATSGPIIISETNPIKSWADETMGDHKFGWVNLKVSENEYYHIELKYMLNGSSE